MADKKVKKKIAVLFNTDYMCIFVMRPAMKNNLVANVVFSHDAERVNRKALQRFQVE